MTSSSNASVSPAWHRFTKSNSDTSDCAGVASVCMIGRSASLFHSTLKAVRAETAAPLSAIFTHQDHDAVADFEEMITTQGCCQLRAGQRCVSRELNRRARSGV